VRVTVFQNYSSTAALAPGVARLGPGGRGKSTLAICAKRKGGRVIENKQSGEIADSVRPMISRSYNPVAKPLVSLGEMLLALSLACRLVEAPDEMKRNQRPFRLAGWTSRDAAWAVSGGGRSKMAPQAIGIARNGLENGNLPASQSPRRRAGFPC
jgi:hypothetical protein